jgi:uncharacterized protein
MLRSLQGVAAGVSQRWLSASTTAGLRQLPLPGSGLAEQQALLAEALLTDLPIDGFDPVAIARTRSVLNDKRIDDALPMLPRLSRFRHRVEAIARPHVESWPRPDDLVGPSDAMRIAELAVADAPLANEARFDRLMLRARFVERGRAVQPRVAPFVGRERIGARTIWAFKGPGKSAAVRVAITGGGAT